MTTSLDVPRWRQILAPGISTQVLDEALAERIKERLDRLESENQRLRIKAGECYPPPGRISGTVEVSTADFSLLLESNEHLRAQVDELQAKQTRMVNRQLSRRVREFHVAMGLGSDDATSPRVPADPLVRTRLRLVAEEFFELLDASLAYRYDRYERGYEIESVRELTMAVINHHIIKVDLPELADALADLEYVIEGTRAVFGIDGAPVMDAVHEANMAKAPGGKAVYREDGKILKPEGWKPPDVAGVLRRQGWRG